MESQNADMFSISGKCPRSLGCIIVPTQIWLRCACTHAQTVLLMHKKLTQTRELLSATWWLWTTPSWLYAILSFRMSHDSIQFKNWYCFCVQWAYYQWGIYIPTYIYILVYISQPTTTSGVRYTQPTFIYYQWGIYIPTYIYILPVRYIYPNLHLYTGYMYSNLHSQRTFIYEHLYTPPYLVPNLHIYTRYIYPYLLYTVTLFFHDYNYNTQRYKL